MNFTANTSILYPTFIKVLKHNATASATRQVRSLKFHFIRAFLKKGVTSLSFLIKPRTNLIARHLSLKEYFHQNNDPSQPTAARTNEVPRLRCKGTWTPPSGRDAALDTYNNAVEHDIMSSQPSKIQNNLSKEERTALTNLRKRSE